MPTAHAMQRVYGRMAMCRRTEQRGATMSPEKRLTEADVKVLINEEQERWREEVRHFQKDQVDVNERLLGGASAAILSATILHGSAENGLKGAIPDIQERLTSLERRADDAEKTSTARHEANEGRFTALEKGQHRLRRAYDATLKTDGHYSLVKLSSAVAAVSAIGHEMNVHGQAFWTETKRFLIALGAAMR